MTSEALKRLTSSSKNYDLSVDIMASGKQGEIAVKAVLTLFTPGVDGKPGVTDRRVVGMAMGADFKTVKAEAVADALEAAGI
jgi:hypothetical protein